MLEFRSYMNVDLIDMNVSDELVAKAARVSTGNDLNPDDNYHGLINFLMKERHGSPFEHGVFTFRVEAPIFVWREHMRHRMASYNEESGRYRVLQPVFYVPSNERNLIQRGKPGAYEFVEGTAQHYYATVSALKEASEHSYMLYQRLLVQGIGREIARMVLPVNIFSSAYVTMNPRALMNFLSLRTKSEDSAYPSYPQREIEMVAEQYEYFFKELMPATHDAFERNGRVAP